VLLKVGNMRGLDLSLFDFDFDLTWAAMMFDDQGRVLGRFGGRDAETPGKYHSLAAMRYSLEQAWQRFERGAALPPPAVAASNKKIEDYAGAQRFSAKSCFHCHNVAEFRREEKQAAGTWRKDEVWVFPEPATLGLTLELDQGNKVRDVRADSPAAKTGLKPGDALSSIHGYATASIADVQYALHQAPAQGTIEVRWQRGDKAMRGEIVLPDGWRQTDLSWRWSLKSMKPLPQVHGDDLTAAEKQSLGLAPRQLAFRQGAFVPQAAAQAGIRIGDLILGVDGKSPEMSAREFDMYMRLNYQVGDTVHYDILRGKERLKIAVKLPG
jgi:predicted metalloprotease with PDZ domain